MNELPVNAVMQRLDRLERDNRWWKRVGIAAMSMLGLAAILGEAGNKDVKVLEEIRTHFKTLRNVRRAQAR